MNKYFVFMLLTACTLISCNDDEDVVDDFPKINHVFSFEDKKVFVRPGMEVEIEALEPISALISALRSEAEMRKTPLRA